MISLASNGISVRQLPRSCSKCIASRPARQRLAVLCINSDSKGHNSFLRIVSPYGRTFVTIISFHSWAAITANGECQHLHSTGVRKATSSNSRLHGHSRLQALNINWYDGQPI